MAISLPLDSILAAEAEVDNLDFKQAFDPKAPGDWLELVKDIVAMSNSGGGSVLIGCLNNGHAVGVDAGLESALDSANLENKVFNYTGVHLRGVTVSGHQKNGKLLVLIRVPGAEYPMPFIKVGTYTRQDGKEKNAFSQGTLYFRHCAKSEPAHADDLRLFVGRKVAEVKEFWLAGIRQVVEAKPDSLVAVLPAEVRLTSSPDAPAVRITSEMAQTLLAAPMVDQTHPFRGKEVIAEFNRRMVGRISINQHHLVCVRRSYNIQRDFKFCYNMNGSSPRYSEAFVEWLVGEYEKNGHFFDEAKSKADALKQEKVSTPA
jgi:hypothetical protein